MKKRICIIAILALLIFAASGCRPAPSVIPGVAAVKIEYFYFNACAACKKEEEITEKINGILAPVKGSSAIDLQLINIFNSENYDRFLGECKKARVAKPNPDDPYVFIDGQYLQGDNEISQRLPELFLEAEGAAAPAAGSEDSAVTYFYVSPCADCDEIGAWLAKLSPEVAVEKNGKNIQSRIVIQKYNVAEQQNFELARDYFKAYGVPSEKQKVPVMFLNGSYFSGVADIEKSLLRAIERGGALVSGRKAVSGAPGSPGAAPAPGGFPAVFLAGLVNGLNPCSISMLLFFLAAVLVKRKDIVKLGLLFIAGKMVTYAVLGALLFTAFSGISSSAWSGVRLGMKIFLVVVAVAAAAVNVWDFAAAKHEKYGRIVLQLPAGLRKFNHVLIGKVEKIENAGLLAPFSFLLGLVVAAGEFLCTGQIYLMTLIYLAKSGPAPRAFEISAIVLYVVAMMLPLAALLLLVWKGRGVYEVSEAARRKIPAVKLINTALFLAMAVAALYFY